MPLKKLTTDMLGFRLAEEKGIEPGWFVPHIYDIIRYNPEGCFAFDSNNQVIGMITSTPYNKTGWLGWLYVAEKERQRGLGEELMRAGIEHLQARGIESILLEAVVKASSLYERLGFREQFTTQHYQLNRFDFTGTVDQEIIVHAIEDYSIERIGEFDRRFFYEDRRRLFEIVSDNSSFKGYVAEIEDKTAGILFLTRSSENRQVSPMVVDVETGRGTEIMSALFNVAFAGSDLPLYFRCPLVTVDRSLLLEKLGAAQVNYHTIRMVLGEDYPLERDGVLSLGCPGKG